MKSNKAQGLSLDTIVIAAIVLTILVVLIMVFTGRMTWFNDLFHGETSKECGDYGGTWEIECNPETQQEVFGLFEDRNLEANKGKKCCGQKESTTGEEECDPDKCPACPSPGETPYCRISGDCGCKAGGGQ